MKSFSAAAVALRALLVRFLRPLVVGCGEGSGSAGAALLAILRAYADSSASIFTVYAATAILTGAA